MEMERIVYIRFISIRFLLFTLSWIEKILFLLKKMYVLCAYDDEYDYDYDDCHMNIQKFRLYCEHSIATNTFEFRTFFSFVHSNGHHFDLMAYNNRWPVWHTECFALPFCNAPPWWRNDKMFSMNLPSTLFL